MALRFMREDFTAAQKRACREMAGAKLRGILILYQDSIYYPAGHETSGYSMFQSIYLRADGALALLTRCADQMNTFMSGGGDLSASRWPMGAAEDALLVLYHTGQGKAAARGQVQFEIANSYRHYHTALMYVILIDKTDPRHREMLGACAAALQTCEETLKAGNTVGQVFEAHARVFRAVGNAGQFRDACGYTMGTIYSPTWTGLSMILAGEPQVVAPSIGFFLHMVLLNSDIGLSMALGEAALITESGCDRLGYAARGLTVK